MEEREKTAQIRYIFIEITTTVAMLWEEKCLLE